MRFQTDRLIVRNLTPDDLDAAHALLDLDLKMDACSREERRQWLQWTLLTYQETARLYQPPYGERAVALRETGEVIGAVGLVPALAPFGLLPAYVEQAGGRVEARAVPEVGLFWAIATAHQRRGYATEAARALVQYAFDALHLRRVIATTEADNAASIGVMRRLGMRVERNPAPAPFWLQIVGMLENPDQNPRWPAKP